MDVKQHELDALRLENEYLQATVDALPVAVVVADTELRVLVCNAAFERAVGVRPRRIDGAELFAVGTEVLHPDGTTMEQVDWPLVRALRDDVVVPEQVIRLRRDGRTLHVLCSASPLRHAEGGAPYAALATFTDITRRREAARALEESEAHFRLLAENSTDVITRHDGTGTCLYASPSLRDLLGRAPSELQDRQAVDFVHREDRTTLLAAFVALLRSGEVATVRYRMSHVDGRWVWVETVMRPVRLEGLVLELQSSTRDITARVETEHRLARLALGDALTGLANRAALHQHLEDRLEGGRPLALLFLDLDRFKVVNDSLGHSAGDELLRSIAARLNGTCRDGDLVARLGGDEFVVVADGLDEAGALLLAGRVQRAVSAPVLVGSHELRMTASVGIVTTTGAGERDVDALLRDADVSMYEAKARGRARAVVWSAAAGESAMGRLTVEEELREALATDQLLVHYQPQVELATGAVVGVEALVRWVHPVRGLLPPSAFLRVAEDSGMVVELGRQVLHTAVQQVAAWRRLPGRERLTLSVNLSTQELLDPDHLDVALETLRGFGLPPSALMLEVLESVLLDPEGAVIDALGAYVRHGVRLALDDFGTGSSSLLHLRHVPVETVKIDRTFVAGLGTSRQDEAIVRALLSLTTDLGLDCLAEGVEDAGQREWLVAEGVRVAQGFLLHPPLPAQELGALLSGAVRTGLRG